MLKKTAIRVENPAGTGPEKSGKPDRLLSKDYILLMGSAFTTNVLNYTFLTTLAPFMVLLTGKAVYGGLMTSVYSIMAIVARPLSGIISDRSGRVRLLVAGALICAVSSFGFGMTTVLAMLIILRMMMGIGFGMHSTCAGAAVADVLPKSRLAEGIGYYGLYSMAGQMLAPAFALYIVAEQRISDYRILYSIIAGICVVGAITGSAVSYERKAKKNLESAGTSDMPGDIQTGSDKVLPKTILGFEYAVFAPCIVLAFFTFSMTSVLSYVTLFAASKDFGNSGFFFTFSALGVLAARLTTGRIVDKRGSDVIVIPALMITVICLLLVPFMPNMILLAALAVPIGLAQAAVIPTLNTMAFRRCSSERRGTASAAYYSMIDIGIAVGAPILGIIVDEAGYITMYWIGSAVCLLALGFYAFVASDKRFNARQAAKRLPPVNN